MRRMITGTQNHMFKTCSGADSSKVKLDILDDFCESEC